ncbi:MAG: NUDIX domain-containing protein [Bacteroidota bacterium]
MTASDLVFRLSGRESTQDLLILIAAFEENSMVKTLSFQSPDVANTWISFRDIYKIMDAAGGIVFNPMGEVLMIYRNDRWDLPKGKVEKGETFNEAAIREVEEECGISNLSIIKSAATTYHTYPYGVERILKCTYWYIMKCDDPDNIKPQEEEGITSLKWMNQNELHYAAMQSYSSIINLLQEEKILM